MADNQFLAARSSHPQLFDQAFAVLGATQIAVLHQQAVENHGVVNLQAERFFLPTPGRPVSFRGGPLAIQVK